MEIGMQDLPRLRAARVRCPLTGNFHGSSGEEVMKPKAARSVMQAKDVQPANPAAMPAPESGKAVEAKVATPARTKKTPPARPASVDGGPARDTYPGSAQPETVAAESVPATNVKDSKSPAAKPAKARKPKLVRDSFTMSETEYAKLADIKQACLQAGFEVKKSQLVRIGISLASALDAASLRQHLDALPALKPRRPKAS
jgi:hypothetical protein